jgi:hypothetical protein
LIAQSSDVADRKSGLPQWDDATQADPRLEEDTVSAVSQREEVTASSSSGELEFKDHSGPSEFNDGTELDLNLWAVGAPDSSPKVIPASPPWPVTSRPAPPPVPVVIPARPPTPIARRETHDGRFHVMPRSGKPIPRRIIHASREIAEKLTGEMVAISSLTRAQKVVILVLLAIASLMIGFGSVLLFEMYGGHL